MQLTSLPCFPTIPLFYLFPNCCSSHPYYFASITLLLWTIQSIFDRKKKIWNTVPTVHATLISQLVHSLMPQSSIQYLLLLSVRREEHGLLLLPAGYNPYQATEEDKTGPFYLPKTVTGISGVIFAFVITVWCFLFKIKTKQQKNNLNQDVFSILKF